MSWYELKLDADYNGTFLVTATAFPEVTTFGDSMKIALANGRNAIEEAIAARIATGDIIPMPKQDDSGPQYAVQMSLLVLLKAGLYSICKAKSVTRAELARRLKWHREQVDRLFRLGHNSRLDQFELAFKAIGVTLRIPIPTFSEAA